MNSAIYSGRVTHARSEGVAHAFTYRHALVCIDLDELPGLFTGRWLWSVERPNLVSFRRRDYHGDSGIPLADAIRARVRAELGRAPLGPVHLYTQPRMLGLAFNPVSFYFCYGSGDEGLQAIVAEITNTPWNERHAYVLDARVRRAGRVHARFAKRFHVSPFQPMEQDYVWEFSEPGAELRVRMENFAGGRCVHRVDMVLERRPLDGVHSARLLIAFPALSLRTLAAIYLQAWLLRWKGAPFSEHPRAEAKPAGVDG